MKRYLLLFCTAVLCCTLIAVPAFAAGDEPDHSKQVYRPDFDNAYRSIEVKDYYFQFPVLPSGYYVMRFGAPDEGEDLILEESTVFYYDGPSDDLWSSRDDDAECYMRLTCVASTDGLQFMLANHFDDGQIEHLYQENESGDSYMSLIPCTLSGGDGSSESDINPSPTGILEVFTSIGAWIGSALGTLSGVFWSSTTNSLTFLGVLAVAGLALAVVLLVIFVVVRFLRFRG